MLKIIKPPVMGSHSAVGVSINDICLVLSARKLQDIERLGCLYTCRVY